VSEGGPKRRRQLHLLQLLPNFATLLALCAGITAIRYAAHDQFTVAAAMIGVAAVLDALDGRLARMLRSESAIGAELDSLADLVNFGVAPALILYFWALQDAGAPGWIAVLVLATCCMLRLARFNVGNRLPDKPAALPHFVGVPAPAGAMLGLAPLFLDFALPQGIALPDEPVMLWMVVVGALMISRIPTPSLKGARIYADNARFILVGLLVLVAAVLAFPWVTLLALDAIYLASIFILARRRPRH